MTETQRVNPGIIGPSKDQWLMLTASFHGTTKVHGVKKDGHFFVDEHHTPPVSIDLLTYAETNSHTSGDVGGDGMDANKIVKRFYDEPIVEHIYARIEDEHASLLLVVSDEIDNLSLRIAEIQNELVRELQSDSIEVSYLPKEYFDEMYVPHGAVSYPRG